MISSHIVDAAIVAIMLLSIAVGRRRGGYAAGLGLAGVLVGGYGGFRAVPWVLHQMQVQAHGAELSPGWRFLAALVTIIGCVVVGYGIGDAIGVRLRDRIRTRQGLAVDSLVGALVHTLTTGVILWVILAPIAANGTGSFGQAVKHSSILSAMEDATPPWVRNLPARTGALIDASGLPAITDPFETLPRQDVSPPDPEVVQDPEVAQAARSVVQVQGKARQCSRMIQGSGFVVAKDVVMTNAHVVAGTDEVSVVKNGKRTSAEVTFYDPQNDIALLSAPGLGLAPLEWAGAPAKPGQDAVVLGYPLGGPFEATPARIAERFTVSGPNIYTSARVEREAYALNARVVHGNSGGPLVDMDGKVLGLIFGADANQSGTGYALTEEEVRSQVANMGAARSAVGTGACVAAA